MRKNNVLLEHFAELPQLAALSHHHPGELAGLLDISLRPLERQSHRYFRMPPAAWLRQLWLFDAEMRLAHHLAKQITDAVGCARLTDFCRRFKAACGMTIKQWQDFHQKNGANSLQMLFTLLSRNAHSKKLLSH